MNKYKRIILIVGLLLIFISGSGQTAQVLDFGELAPLREVVEQRTIPLSLTPETVNLELRLEPGYLETENSRRLAGSRIKVATAAGTEILTSTPIIISIDDFRTTFQTLVLPLELTLLPIDMPGKYRTKLIIQQLDSQGQRVGLPAAREVLVEVAPWLTIEQIEGREVISVEVTDYRNQSVFSRGEPALKIAANTSWKLYTFLEGNSQFKTGSLKVEIPGKTELYTELRPEGFYLEQKPVNIVIGGKTTGENSYWIEIPIKLTIENFTTIKAGQIIFPVNFAVAYFD